MLGPEALTYKAEAGDLQPRDKSEVTPNCRQPGHGNADEPGVKRTLRIVYNYKVPNSPTPTVTSTPNRTLDLPRHILRRWPIVNRL